MSDGLQSLLQKSEGEQKQVKAFTPEECNVYSQQAILLRLCSEERRGDPLGWNECRSSEQSRDGESRRAINIALLRSEERAYRTLDSPQSDAFEVVAQFLCASKNFTTAVKMELELSEVRLLH